MPKHTRRMPVTLLIAVLVTALCANGQQASRQSRELLDAARNGKGGKVRSLLAGGVNPNIKDADGRTPLHLAAANGHQLTAGTLLKHGAKINAKDSMGRTPLDLATSASHRGCAKFLVGKGGLESVGDVKPTPPPPSSKVPSMDKRTPSASTGSAVVVWDMTQSGRFDRTNKAYPISAGRVVVDLSATQSRCPTGLGGLAEGRGNVREIVLRYEVREPGDHWLHIQWDPGGSGKEQFEVTCNGQPAGATEIVDATLAPRTHIQSSFKVPQKSAANELVLRQLSGDGLHFHSLILSTASSFPRILPGELRFPNVESFSKAIGEQAAILDSENVCMFVPSRCEKAAAIVLPYLTRAYDELYKIVGVHTRYKIVVYAYPKGFPGVRGGTSGCVIRYTDENLDLKRHAEWKRYRVPHVSGYIEEMAHNFVHAAGAEFGWEMIGWTIGAKVSSIVAPNPIHKRQVGQTRQGQRRTYRRYMAGGKTFPRDIPPNQVDRIHAHLLWTCERKYGPDFWSDFFTEVRRERASFSAPEARGESSGLDVRYRLTVECFDRLVGLNFRKLLEHNGISTNVAIQSLKPEKPGWNRRLME